MKRIRISGSIMLGVGVLLALAGFVFSNERWIFLVFSALALIIGAFCLIFSKTVLHHCTLKTTVVSLGLSFIGAAGLVCWFFWFTIVIFTEMSRYPYLYPASFVGMIISFVVFRTLLVLYIFLRKNSFSVQGVLIDVVTARLFFPCFCFLCGEIYDLLAKLI